MSAAWLKYPKTAQESRYNSDEDHAPFVRAKRRKLPTAYDDIKKQFNSKRRPKYRVK